ncbi:Bax inhibitor-1/YccA family protein [Actinomyces sp. HMSC035G02]|uniref:Bax inhibitor-1/YccA family protein n=1 Tax=Actinomyces sp. HMSC035G02 TaxID=1739406 RepID=UPI0008A89F78|nr:Bax inhibitor-1/YccA family protein [Actinomyces sp. HMSC035G02]MBS5724049.1 Bax inhibitor-1/YccA family protein [Actinomyces sp.]OHR20778.1 Bax1 inhibitor-like family protein [Actinomyces sp. HMSC035G02]
MANPVMNSIVKDWSTQSTTPAGYPEMPGYQPASQQAQNPYAGATNPYGAQQGVDYSGQPVYGTAQAGTGGSPVSSGYEEQMASYEAMMNAPAADAVDRGMMTFDDVVVKSIMCFGLLLVGAVAGWMTGIVAMGVAMVLFFASCAVTLGLAIFIQFSKKIRPGAIVTYSLIEGFSLGVISYTFEAYFPGIVISAVLATLVVIGTTLAAFMMGFVRNSSTLTRVAGIGSIAFFFYYLVTFALSVTGLVDMTAVNNAKIFGIPLGIIIGVLAVFIGVLCLVRDFDAVKVGVANNVPEKYSWLCTFAIMTDVIWIYLEILKILSYFMRRD